MGEKTLVIILNIIILFVISINNTYAEIYKHIDKDGRITYTNKLIKGANKLKVESITSSINKDTTKLNKNFSNVVENTQKNRDIKRRQILENELAAEKKLLADAKQSLIIVQKNSQGPNNDNLSNFQRQHASKQSEELERGLWRHKKNITALKKELTKF